MNKYTDNDVNQMRRHQSQGAFKAQMELKQRLYDKGFQMGTMPSVKRPETAKSKDRILTAKLNSQQAKSQKHIQPVYQPQSVVLHKKETSLPQIQDKNKQQNEDEFTLDQNDTMDNQQFGRNFPNRPQTAKLKINSQKNFALRQNFPNQDQQSSKKPQSAQLRPETATESHNRILSGTQTTQIQQKMQEKPISAQIERKQMQSERQRIQSAKQNLQINDVDFLLGFDFHKQINHPEEFFGPPLSTISRIQSAKHIPNLHSQSAKQQVTQESKIKLQDIFGQQEKSQQFQIIQQQQQMQMQQSQYSSIQGLDDIEPPEIKVYTINIIISQFKGFEELREMPKTKHLVDKLSGKFNIDKRYLARPKTAMKSKQDEIQIMEQSVEEEQVIQKMDSNQITSYKRPATKLDKYIDLILKNVTNVNEFIYLKAQNEDDPYDLQVVDFKKIQDDEKKKQLKEYYTISRKGLCHYVNGKPIEFIQLAYWLKERETYDQIKCLTFFQKFRKWKTLKMWRRNVVRHKNTNCARTLEDKLFYLNPIMRKTLLDFRSNTYDMMNQLRFIGLDDKENHMTNQEAIFTLQQFKENQDVIRRKVNSEIQVFSQRCREIVKSGFDDSLAKLRKDQYMSNNEDDFGGGAQKKQTQNMFGLKETAYDALGFPDNMTYEKRSELRKECSKFLRFAYLVDFLAMESLSKIFINSVQELEDKLKSLVQNQEEIFIAKDPAQKNFSPNEIQPMFLVSIQPQLQLDNITSEHFQTEKIKEYIGHPLGTSKPDEFNILYHVREKPPKKPKEEQDLPKAKKAAQPVEESESEDIQLNEDEEFDRTIVPNITDLWLKVYPDRDMFFKDLMRCIAEGANSIQAFERWSRHDDMRKYVRVLEEWDDIVGDDWENADSNYLNPSEWLDNSPNEMFQAVFRKLVEQAFNGVDSFARDQFHKFLLLYWENQMINFEIFKSENLMNPGESYQCSFKILNIQKEYFEKEIPYSADLGLLRVDTSEIRKLIVNEPEKKLKIFQEFVPPMIQERNNEIRQWLINQANLLKGNALNIDEFVKRQVNLKETLAKLPRIKRKFYNLDHIKGIMYEFKFEMEKNLIQAITDTTQDLKRLENIIQTTEEQSDRNIERYARDVSQKLVPELEKNTNELASLVQDKKFLTLESLQVDKQIEELSELHNQYQQLENKSLLYNHYERTLNLVPTRYEDLETLKIDITLRLNMWKSLKEWSLLTEQYTYLQFTLINVKEIKERADFYTKVVSKCTKNMPQNPVLDKLRKLVFTFKEAMPVVVALRNKDLQPTHWKEIKRIINQDFVIDEEFTLKHLLDMGVTNSVYEIQEVATQATQEALLKSQFEALSNKWKHLTFTVKESKEGRSKDVTLLSDVDDLQQLLDELLANLNNILGSRYLKNMRDEVDLLQKKVLNVQECMDDMLIVQKNWIYLENIFKSNEIRSKLKDETAQFDKVDTFFRKQLANIKKNQLIMKCIGIKSKKDWNLQKEMLNSIQQALDNLLEEKRSAFPRFYFLSNDELLEILAKSTDIEAIQKNMKKCFDGVHRLYIIEQGISRSIQGMISPENEKITFIKSIQPKGDVEIWLLQFQELMRETLYKNMKKGKQDYEGTNKERHEWVLDHPAQVIATVAMIMWTQYTEIFIVQQGEESPTALYDWANLNYIQLESLTKLITQGLPDIQHRSIVALITQDVHGRDILDNLCEEGVMKVQDFLWQKQLRYYWDDDQDTIACKQINANIKYGFEYFGATSRLVITNLTDRAWMTITGALNIQLGAAPAGPAGTGKTESTKDLAKGLGVLCVVFNCSEQIEYKMMGRLFSGLSEQGAWACLDEFNRIDIEVLSVIAQQLQTIRNALVRGDAQFQFVDKVITLKKDGYGVFITMNPGYAGRTELPDNLKVLFRPVAMMIPDYGMIAEIMLFSEGFENASSLSKKMVQLYKLASEQLSQQDHYDFGMRAVKSVLNMAGNLKRQQPDLNEDAVLIRAMRDSNMPKFLKDDLTLFMALIQDLFPKVNIPDADYGELPLQIEKSTKYLNYQFVPELSNKVIQLFETLDVRFGVMIVGQTTSGKTTCYEILADAMTQLRISGSNDKRFQEVMYKVLNPKCITMGELYGEVNPTTYEWMDGLGSSLMRDSASDETDKKQWMVFDGPVDALWIENMNTVLDDNMMLCLANGQRIKLRPQMRMIIQDLKVASPATVSRCGMVYMLCENLGWRPYVLSWISSNFGPKKNEVQKQQSEVMEETVQIEEENPDSQNKKDEILTEDLRIYLYNLFDNSVDRTITYIRTKLKEVIVTVDLQLVTSLCNLLDCFITEEFGFKQKDKVEEQKRFLAHVFSYAFIWSMGITIKDNYYDHINNLVRDLFQNVIFPNQETVYSYYLDVRHDLIYKHWNDKIDEFEYDKDVPYFNLLVPTIDTTRFAYIIEWLMQFKKHTYLTGQGGTGKSVILQKLLESIKEPKQIDSFQLIFSAQTHSMSTQLTIEDKLKKKSKFELGAISGHKNVIFIDDCNMPSVEVYGAQPPIELLRLYIDKGYFWDRKERFLKQITDTTLLCCSAPPGGGRTALTSRFTRHFNLLALPSPSHNTLHTIFKTLFSQYLQHNNFVQNLQNFADHITNMTIETFQRFLAEKLPIPSKFHYTFNLRDVSKVFQGLMMSHPSVLKNDTDLCRLWIHEISRVFHDRLISDQDRNWFYDLAIELCSRNFKGKWDKDTIFGEKKIIFSDILRLDMNKEYEEILGFQLYFYELDLNKLTRCLDEKLEEYNSGQQKQKMNLVFFEMCVEHMLRILRVLRQIRGNAMLIGVGGSGKQSLTKLSSFILEYETEQVEIKRDYNIDSFREFIQNNLMYKTGVGGKGVTFLFNDNQIINESFLEDINNILNSGEVPNMWKQEDKENILSDMKEINARNKKPTDPDTCYKTFVERVRNSLHIVLCMSPVGDALRIRCRQFPSLVDCCALNWFTSWPETALVSVSLKILQDEMQFPQPQQITKDDLQNSISMLCKDVHLQGISQADKFEAILKRKVYFTPKSFLDLIRLYIQALYQTREEALTTQKRLSSGLTKLEEANKQIAELQISLNDLVPQLEQQNIAVAKALKKVESDTVIAQEQEAMVSEETEKVQKQKDRVQLIADEAQSELDKVLPELNKAQEAVEKIDRNQLVNLRTMNSKRKLIKKFIIDPPAIVLMVFEGVAALFGQKSDWITCKSNLMDLNKFIQSLVNYDKDNIPIQRLKKLNQVLAKPEFDIPSIQSKVPYAADLAMFCRAMKIYSDTFSKVKPKKLQVAELQAELDVANAALNKQLEALHKVQSSVQRLREETNEMMNKKEELEKNMELTEQRLIRAKKLITLTADEAARWQITVGILNEEIEKLYGDVFISVAQISYNGPFTVNLSKQFIIKGSYRKELTDGWNQQANDLKIPKSENSIIIKTLGDSMQLREWGIQGLPSDQVSQENSIFATKGIRWPLLIDPQLQATRWIKNMEAAQLICLKFTGNWIREVTNAITNGYAVLIEEVDESIDPGLDNILAKAIYDNEGQKLIKFADSELVYDNNFRLYLTTKKPNPNYLPEIFIKVNVINFTSTFEGLEDQLLADVVKNEKPDVEMQRDQNIQNLAQFKKRIEVSEKNILKLLAEANADSILDNIPLITTLEVSKSTAVEIQEQLEQSEILEKKINIIRESYRKISIRGSILYFVIRDLSLIDPMYQYSLQYIQKLFRVAMANTQPYEDFDERQDKLINKITETIFQNVCRGLFEKDKQIFSFLIATSINKNSLELSEQYWSIFLRGASVLDKSKQPPIPNKDMFSQAAWDIVNYLDQTFEEFTGLTKHIITKINLWKNYYTCQDPVEQQLPEPWNTLGIFQRILILKIFRPEKILFAISVYLKHYLGNFYLDPPHESMVQIHLDSDPKTPLIFVLSQGADPSQLVLTFTQQMNMTENLKSISLGQGQGEKAEVLIREGLENGYWIFLQNCHLAKTWMPKFENIMADIRQSDNEGIHKDFRMFLTSMPVSYFPISILQNGIKMTTEPPRGLKANLKRSWGNLTQEFLDSCKKTELNETFHKLVWGLTYFHALIQERRKFGPLGWNIRYEFNDSDLETSSKVMKMLLEEQELIPWDSMLYVSGHINYGGRVTDEWDRRCLITMLKKFYTEEILKPKYLFSDSSVYVIPDISPIEQYRQFIENLPIYGDPSVFGLNENANITYQQQESNSMIKTILNIQPRAQSQSGGKSSDEQVIEVLEQLQKQLPEELNKDDGLKEMFEINEQGLIESLSTVLLQEMARFNNLLQIMRTSLKNLKLSIEGLMIMSEDLDSTYYSLLNNQLPKIWENKAYPSLKPLGTWILDLIERVRFMHSWLKEGNPSCFWISGFFFPQGFLTGVLQTHARKQQTAIDQLDFMFRVLDFDYDSCPMRPIDGEYIYGLFLEGANWDRKKKTLQDALPGQTYQSMPVIYFNPVENLTRKEQDYSCPLYKTSQRAGTLSTTGQSTNFIIAVDLPSVDQLPDFWTLRGTALLSQLDE